GAGAAEGGHDRVDPTGSPRVAAPATGTCLAPPRVKPSMQETRPMNVIELLKKDHQTVSGLFKTFESAKESENQVQMEQTAAQICEELTAHATVEEELFYPAVEARAGGEDEKAEDSVKEAHEEHALVKQLVGELQGMGPDDEQFEAKVKVLKDLVEHHVEEEEGTLMPRAKKLLSSEELDEMGTRVEARKGELRSESQASEARMAQGRSSST